MEWIWGEGFGSKGLGVRGEGEGARARAGSGEGESVCGLNAMGPKIIETQFNRSDRLSRPVRPVHPRLIGEVLVLCFAM